MTILAGLIENGVNPEALAAVVKELKRETEALKVGIKLIFILIFNDYFMYYRRRQDNDSNRMLRNGQTSHF